MLVKKNILYYPCVEQTNPSIFSHHLKANNSSNNYRYHRKTLKYHYGSGLADLENAEDYNNFFFTVKK